jgi:hypothetical protein
VRTGSASIGGGGQRPDLNLNLRSVGGNIRNWSEDLRSLGGDLAGNDYRRFVQAVTRNPLAMSIAGGVGAYFVGRFIFRYYRNHPEISEFIRDNFDTVESRLRDFRGDETEARH